MSLKKKVTIIFLCFLLSITGVVATTYWVKSGVKTVTITNYIVTLDFTTNGLNVYFTGRLTLSEVGIGDKMVYLNQTNFDGSFIKNVACLITNTEGYYNYTWSTLVEGTYYFESSYLVS